MKFSKLAAGARQNIFWRDGESLLLARWSLPVVMRLALALLTGMSMNVNGACLAPPSGLVSWWSGDDAAYDLTGFNHGAVRFGAGYADGKVGRGFNFDGTSNYVQTTTWGMNVGTLDFTIVGWAKTTATKSASALLEFDYFAPALFIKGTNGILQLYPASETTVGGFNDGQFHHFAVSRKDGVVSYFKDGVLIGTASLTGSLNQNRFLIGSDTILADAFQGVIDEVAFFERALSTNEIAAIFAAGTDGMCKPAAAPSLQFFIEAEDFDFNGGQHNAEADSMPYFGGVYVGLSATAEIDYHDPGTNENAAYRSASQGVATGVIFVGGDASRDSYTSMSNFKVGWNDPGDWFNYTRVFPSPARNYNIYARLSSGSGTPSAANAIQVDQVVSGAGTTTQTLTNIGKAQFPASGSFENFLFIPVLDGSGNLATVNFGGQKTLRVTMLDVGTDINYLHFVPVDYSTNSNCVTSVSGLVAWWPGDGHPFDLQGTNHGTLRNGATYATNKVGEGFVFDGANDYVETALDAQPSAMPSTTWECWVFPTHVDAYRDQILSTDDGGYDRSVGVENGNFAVFVGFGVWFPIGITPHQWQHIAVVYTTNNVEFYKNGVRFSWGVVPPAQPTLNKLQIGRNPGFGEYFPGRIDEVGIYNRALSAAEIQAIYNAGGAGRCKSTVACPNVAVSPLSLSAVTAGGTYSQTLTASGGAAPYTFVPTSGMLPPTFMLSSNGLLSGSLVSTRIFSFSVRVTDSNGCSKGQSYALTVLPLAPACTNLPPGLVSWWRAESNANDSMGLNPGVLSPGTSYATGKAGQAFQFFGTNGITVFTNGLNVGTNDFSVEGWIKTSSGVNYSPVFVYNYYNPGIYIRGSGHLQLYPAGLSSSNGFNDGQFHHFAVVRQGPGIAYFKDGVAAGAVAYSPPMNLNEQNIFIGKDPAPQYFDGEIDELSFYNHALSSSEVQNIFARDSGGKCGSAPTNNAPDIALNATNINFGNVTVSNSTNLTLTVSNVGTSALTVTSLATNHPAFRIVSPATPFNVGAGAQAVVTLRFSPTNAGLQNATLSIASSDPDEPALAVALAGSGVNPVIPPDIALSATSLNFGNVTVGNSINLTLMVSNVGAGTLTVTSLTTNHPAFRVVSPATPFNIGAGAQASVTLRFSPTLIGLQNGNLSIASNDPDEGSLGVTLAGSGVSPVNPPDIALSATNLNFGTVPLGGSNDLTLTVSNVGTSTLTITSFTTNHPAFRVLSPATPLNVSAGTQATVTFRFSPTNSGAHTGAVSIASNDPDEATVNVGLGGSGATNPSSPPVITSITPMNAAPGSLVTLSGTNFGESVSGALVRFGNHVAAIQSITSTQIVVRLPLVLSGPASVSVTVNGLSSAEFSFQIQTPLSSLRITDVSLTPTNSVRLLTQPVWPNPNELLLESSDSPAGPWWKETDVNRNNAPGGHEFFTPRKPHYAQRFFRVGAFAGQALPFIRFIAPNNNVRPGLSVTLLGANFSPTPALNTVRFDLPIQSWTATVTDAGTNYLIVTVPANLLVMPTGTLYRVTVTTAQGTGNGVGCSIYPIAGNAFGLRPNEVFILQPPGTGMETLAIGGGVPPYQILPLTSNESAVAVVTLNGPVVTVVARTNVTSGGLYLRVQDSSTNPPQQAAADIYIRRPDFAPPFTASFHTVLAGTAPGFTVTARFQFLQPEQMELRLQNAQIELSQVNPGFLLGMVRLYYSSSAYGFQHLVVNEVSAGRATFDVVSLESGGVETIARGELIENPPTLVINALGQKAATVMPTTVDQEIIFSDSVFRLPAITGQMFSIIANFTSVSTRDDQYAPLRSSVTNTFTTTGVAVGSPRIERVLPVHAEVRANIRLQGTGFDPNPAGNQVTFAGPNGARVPANILLQTNGEIFVTVPEKAISGPVRLTASGKTGNDFSFFVRFHPEPFLLFDNFIADTPSAPNFIHQQPVDEGETIDEVPLQAVTATLDQGRLAMTGVTSNQQVGTVLLLNYYTMRQATNLIMYKGQEQAPPQRHHFEVLPSSTSSFVLAHLYALEQTNGSGVTFQIESPNGLFQFNAGVMWDYRFTVPIYRPPPVVGADVNVRLEAVSRQWTSLPNTAMRLILNSKVRVR